MNSKWMLIGTLSLLVAGEPACKKKADSIDSSPQCTADAQDFQEEVAYDTFIDHVHALRSGDPSSLPSVMHLQEKWKADNCLAQTGTTVDMVAMNGLYVFYEEQCAPINPTIDDIKKLVHEAAQSGDPEDAQMVALAYICYNVHHADDKNQNPPTSL